MNIVIEWGSFAAGFGTCILAFLVFIGVVTLYDNLR